MPPLSSLIMQDSSRAGHRGVGGRPWLSWPTGGLRVLGQRLWRGRRAKWGRPDPRPLHPPRPLRGDSGRRVRRRLRERKRDGRGGLRLRAQRRGERRAGARGGPLSRGPHSSGPSPCALEGGEEEGGTVKRRPCRGRRAPRASSTRSREREAPSSRRWSTFVAAPAFRLSGSGEGARRPPLGDQVLSPPPPLCLGPRAHDVICAPVIGRRGSPSA